jgi:hypothetical protein
MARHMSGYVLIWEFDDEADPVPAAGDAKLARVHRKLIEQATEQAVPLKVLVRRAGYRVNSYSRAAVTALCRWGYLVRTADGLRRGRPAT